MTHDLIIRRYGTTKIPVKIINEDASGCVLQTRTGQVIFYAKDTGIITGKDLKIFAGAAASLEVHYGKE
jgi:hypothetical protein